MTLSRCPLSIFCSRGTPPRALLSPHSDITPLSQSGFCSHVSARTLSLSRSTTASGFGVWSKALLVRKHLLHSRIHASLELFCRANTSPPLRGGRGSPVSHAGGTGPEAGVPTVVRCRANMAHVRQSRPDSGLGFQVKFPKTF